MTTKRTRSVALTVPFDLLPEDGRVRVQVAMAVTGLGRTTVYELAKTAKFPPIEKIGGARNSVIRVGELRKFLADPAAYKPPVRS